MSNDIAARRQLLAGLALATVCAVFPATAGAQTAAAPSPGYRRRRVRDFGSVLAIGGIAAAIAGWVYIGGKRARKRQQAEQEMQARLARARERSRNL